MKRPLAFALAAVWLASLACGAIPASTTPGPYPTPEHSIFDGGHTAYGFFPSPPQVSTESVMATIKGIGQHGDVLLVQRNIPWNDFVKSPDASSQDIIDARNLMILARQNNLEAVFVVDPLNGLNRRQFAGLPLGWQASFANPDVRAAYTNYTLRILREFHPRYLGLASEINTYADFQPADFPNFLSLYRQVYALVKAEAPQTQVFVTFQWEELNNLIPGLPGARHPYSPRWEQIRIFEPQLDVWAISSYPFVALQHGKDIPADYYSPLLSATSKPLAVAEGGFMSKDVANFHGTPDDQLAYLRALHTQIGSRLVFWIYLLYSDLDLNSYAPLMNSRGQQADVNTLGWFVSVGLTNTDGSPKPALALWDSFRKAP